VECGIDPGRKRGDVGLISAAFGGERLGFAAFVAGEDAALGSALETLLSACQRLERERARAKVNKSPAVRQKEKAVWNIGAVCVTWHTDRTLLPCKLAKLAELTKKAA
jgi:hypothetical protein